VCAVGNSVYIDHKMTRIHRSWAEDDAEAPVTAASFSLDVVGLGAGGKRASGQPESRHCSATPVLLQEKPMARLKPSMTAGDVVSRRSPSVSPPTKCEIG
jgi:hypothetical protein